MVLVLSALTSAFTMVGEWIGEELTRLVDGGERVVLFDRFRGVLPKTVKEGTHFKIPFIQVRDTSSLLIL